MFLIQYLLVIFSVGCELVSPGRKMILKIAKGNGFLELNLDYIENYEMGERKKKKPQNLCYLIKHLLVFAI